MPSTDPFSEVAKTVSQYRNSIHNSKQSAHLSEVVAPTCARVKASSNSNQITLRYFCLFLQLNKEIEATCWLNSLSPYDSDNYRRAFPKLLEFCNGRMLKTPDLEVKMDLSRLPPLSESPRDVHDLIHLIGCFLSAHPTMAHGALLILEKLIGFCGEQSEGTPSEPAQNSQTGRKRKAPGRTALRMKKSKSSNKTTQRGGDLPANRNLEGNIYESSELKPIYNRRLTRSQGKRNPPASVGTGRSKIEEIIDSDNSHDETEPPEIEDITDDDSNYGEAEPPKIEEITDGDSSYDETQPLEIEEITDGDSSYDETQPLKIEEITDGDSNYDETQFKTEEGDTNELEAGTLKYENCLICKRHISSRQAISRRFRAYLNHASREHSGDPHLETLTKYKCHVCSRFFVSELALNVHAGNPPHCMLDPNTSGWEVYESVESHSAPTKTWPLDDYEMFSLYEDLQVDSRYGSSPRKIRNHELPRGGKDLDCPPLQNSEELAGFKGSYKNM
ncbi:hypothetical protein TWF970_010794 [Orbilia oligospora]|uniref:C2H2-type domain-containing protein n=1 Tax=Orbilia oligospora TaxID=2813651 RepID=A0A7C8R457_ORBOL|nr:hypothetical protein TWF970_010794 [Orbilia oligospora]